MKPKHLIAPLIILVVLYIGTHAFAQTRELSLNVGYGMTTTEYQGIKVVLPFLYDNTREPFYHVGFDYTLTTKNNKISFFTGLNLDNRGVHWPTHSSVNYLKAPIGFHLNYGNKLRFLAGGGFNVGVLLSEIPNWADYRHFIFGTFLKVGTGYQISDKYRIMLTYQTNFDLTTMYVRDHQSVSMSHNYRHHRGYDGFLSLSLYYKIGKVGEGN